MLIVPLSKLELKLETHFKAPFGLFYIRKSLRNT